MNEIAVEPQPPFWRRWWANSTFRAIVMMLLEVGAFVAFGWLLTLAVKYALPLPEVNSLEGRAAERGSVVIERALRGIFVVAVAYWLMVRIVQRRRVAELAPRKLPLHAPAGWAAGMAILVVASLLMAAAGVLRWSPDVNTDAELIGPLFMLGLAPGITEELLFRGILFGVVERAFGTWISLAISSVFFGWAHINNPGATLWSSTAIAVEAGLLLGLGYAWTRSMWFVMGLHAAWNFTQGPLLGIPVSGVKVDGILHANLSGPTLLSGGSFGAEGSILTVVMCVAVAAWFGRKAIDQGRIIRPAWQRPAGQYPTFD